jgi:predicted amino acid racemase
VKKIHDLPTPCLVLDLDRFESNLDKMSRFTGERGIALRPHSKTHKCVNIARRQLEKGAIGICAATIAETEVMVRGGIRGLLITGEMVGEPKVSRLVQVILKAPDTMVVVDDVRNVHELQRAAAAAGIRISVLIDLDIGQNRTGTQPGEPALRVAQQISNANNLQLKGLCAYAGHSAHVVGFAERRASSQGALAQALATRDLLLKDGHNVEIISGASTGTNTNSQIEGVTEMQSGSCSWCRIPNHRRRRRLTTISHRPVCSIDSRPPFGNKAIVVPSGISTDARCSEPFGVTGMTYVFAGDERPPLDRRRAYRTGRPKRFIIPLRSTVNLFDRFFCLHTHESVEDDWPIMGVPRTNIF